MVLSDRSISEALETGDIVITPYEPANLQPASVDLRLAADLRETHADGGIIDVKDLSGSAAKPVTIAEHEPYLLQPGQFILASTKEWIEIGPAIVGRLEGKSSLGRLGLVIHSTAGFIDPGWKGTITLELSNNASRPITLYRDMKIGQISFLQLTTDADRPYGSPELGSKYQGQNATTPSRIDEEFHS